MFCRLLQAGRDLEALAIYRKIYLWNHNKPGAAYEVIEKVTCTCT